jgi:urea transport system substrate-binding protein
VWQTDKEVPGDVWSDYLPRSKDIIADWRPSISYGHYDVKTKKCSGKAY